MKYHLSLLFGIFTLLAYGQEIPEPVDIIIDSSIVKAVEERISPFEPDGMLHDQLQLHENVLLAVYYENDSLLFDTRELNRSMPFKVFYLPKSDTVYLAGFYGFFSGFGFLMKWVDKKPYLYHSAAADYAYTPDSPLEYRVDVPCTAAKAVLSKEPEFVVGEVIHGMVQFSSDEYYQVEALADGEEQGGRLRIRMDMTIYFKAKYTFTPY
ncbi:MAG: hypothetical protein AAFP77_20525 [Bacteroidota bacterium]